MEDFVKFLASFLLIVFAIVFVGTLAGTVLWGCYDALLVMFPSAVSSGILAPDLEWWTAVKIGWICGFLIKGGSSSGGSTKKSE